MLRSHAGGVAVSEQYTYLAGGNGICYVLSTEELMDPDCRAVTILGEFSTGNRASFCSRQGGLLLIGEHARGEKFRTADAHHLTTPAGEENPALVTVFQLDDEETLGVSTSPVAAYSIPGRAQGMSFTSDGRAMLSASGAMGASQVYFYDLQAMRGGQQDVFRVLDTEVPLYYLDSSCCQEVLHLPPMAEEIAFENSKLYVLFESASCRFRYGRLVGGDYVYALDPPPRQEREA